MFVRTIVFSLALIIAVPTWAQRVEEFSPFDFARETDIRQEVGITRDQIQRIEKLEPNCDRLCQARIAETFQEMDSGLSQEFDLMEPMEQAQVIQVMGEDYRETIELDALSQGVLEPQQMTRFNQLWVQDAGLDALIKGQSSRDLGMSSIQINQIQNIRNSAFDALDRLSSTRGLSLQQINTQTQNIQVNLYNECAAILTPEQQQTFLEITGQSPPVDSAEGLASGQDGESAQQGQAPSQQSGDTIGTTNPNQAAEQGQAAQQSRSLTGRSQAGFNQGSGQRRNSASQRSFGGAAQGSSSRNRTVRRRPAAQRPARGQSQQGNR